MALELKDIIIGMAMLFVIFVALAMPYKEIGTQSSFSDFDSNISTKISSYEKNITSMRMESKSTYDSTNNINTTKSTLGSAISGSIDFLGSLVQSGFNAARGSVKLVSDGYYAIEDLSNKVGLPRYMIDIVITILFILLAFSLIRLLTGR